tara:strand:+ start:272 stop:796 length:525 start_codon:yes stop_codon:yes gene_type:complete
MAFKMKGSTHYGKNPLKQKRELPTLKQEPQPSQLFPKIENRIGKMTAEPSHRIGKMTAEPTLEKAPQRSFVDFNEQTRMYEQPKLIPLPKTQVEKQRLRKKEMLKKSPAKFDDTVKGKSKKVAKHPLYNKLPSWAKTAYNKLNEKQRANVNKNKSESQLLNSLGGYSPKFEGGD